MLHLAHSQLPFIVNLLILLLCAKVFGEISERLGQPSMIGELIAGIVLGPSLLNIIPDTGEMRMIAELGVFMLIVLAGMEIEVEEIRNSIRGRNIWIALLGFLIPMVTGLLVGIAFRFTNIFTIFLGLCMAITALPVSIRILMDLGKLQTNVGQRIISAAIFSDVLALLILGIILDFNEANRGLGDLTLSILITIAKVGLFTAILMVAYRLFKLAKRKVNVVNPRMNKFFGYLRGKESLFALIILFVLVFASIAELLGLHLIVGAFFGAILLPRSMLAARDLDRAKKSVSGITMGFLAPIFFATMGISFHLQSFEYGTLLLVVITGSIVSKIFGGYLGGRLAGFDHMRSATIGIGLNARGIMELVIANIAMAKGFINVSIYSILILMALVTTILTPFLLRDSFRIIESHEKRKLDTFT
ncbi:MAG: cation:proton antiporter [Bacteroidales bacterium]|nr:cation:proton antiporter [Bacteroidales bacterium]